MTRQQTIQRSPHNKENPYISILRTTAQDKDLSYEARGLLAYLLSKPLDWKVQIHELQHEKYAGRDKVGRIIKELATAGYITRPKKYKDKKGKWCWTPYYVWEESQHEPLTEKPSTDNQSLDSRHTDEPATANTSSYKEQNHKSKTTNQKDKEQITHLQPVFVLDETLQRLQLAYERVIGGTINQNTLDLMQEGARLKGEYAVITALSSSKEAKHRLNYFLKILNNWQIEAKSTPTPSSAPSPSPKSDKGYIEFAEFPGHSRTKGDKSQ